MAELITFKQLQLFNQAVKNFFQQRGLTFNTTQTEFTTNDMVTLEQLQLQAKEIKEFLNDNGWSFVGEVVFDDSGKLVTFNQLKLQATKIYNLFSRSWNYDSDTKLATYSFVVDPSNAEISIYNLETTTGITTSLKSVTIPSGLINSDSVITLAGEGYRFQFYDEIRLALNSNNTSILANPYANIYNADSICSFGDNVYIAAGAGNDTIINCGNNSTIVPSFNNDFISNTGVGTVFCFDVGAQGSNTIEGFNLDSDCFYLSSQNISVYDSVTENGTDFNFNYATNNTYVLVKGLFEGAVKFSFAGELAEYVIGQGFPTLSIYNSDSGVTLIGGAGNDTIYSSGSNNKIYGGGGDDTIYSSGNYNTVYGSGYNSIYSSGSNNKIYGGAGNDTIYSSGSNNKLYGGAGKDTIFNKGNNVSINAGADVDKIFNYGDNVTIYGGAGNDSIINNNLAKSDTNRQGVVYQFGASEGIDTIFGFDFEKDTIKFTRGTASLGNSSASLSADHKKITLIQNGTTVILYAGDDVYGDVTYNVYSADGQDDITLKAGDTVPDGYTAKQENDADVTYTLKERTSHPVYDLTKSINWSIGAATAANSAIEGFTSGTLTVKAIGGSSANEEFGTNAIDNATISALTGNDSIVNTGNNVYINMGASGSNSVINSGTNVTIISGSGIDWIYNDASGDTVTINTGAGNDSIFNYGDNATINGGAGNDSITNGGDNVTIWAGAGNDTIVNLNDKTNDERNGVVYQFSTNDGNTTIVGFDTEKDTIQFTRGTASLNNYNASISPDHKKIMLYSNSSNVVLYNENGTYNLNTEINWSIGAASAANATIPGFTSGRIKPTIVAGTTLADEIVNRDANVTVMGGTQADTITNEAQNVVIREFGTAIDSIINTAANVTIEAMGGNDIIYNTGETTSINAGAQDDRIWNTADNVTIYGHSGNDSILNRNTGTSGVVYLFDASQGSNTIVGFNFEKDTIKFNRATTLPSNTNVSISADKTKIQIAQNATTVILRAEEGETYDFDKGVKVSIGNASSDETLTSGTLYPRIVFGTSGADSFGTIAQDNVTIRPFNGADTITLKAASSWIEAINTQQGKTVVVENTSIPATESTGDTLRIGATNDTITISRDYTYYYDQGGQNKTTVDSSNDTIVVGTGNDTIWIDSGSNNTINTATGNDTIFVGANAGTGNTINTGLGNDKIIIADAHTGGNYFVTAFSTTRYTDSISGWNDDSDCLIVGTLENLEITQEILGSNVTLTFTQGNNTANVMLVGKGAGNKVRYTATPGDASSMQIYTITEA